MDVSALNLDMITAYYNISCKYYFRSCIDNFLILLLLDVTVEVYTLLLKERTKLKGLLEVVSSSAEFKTIPIRQHENALLRRIYDCSSQVGSDRFRSSALQNVPHPSPLFSNCLQILLLIRSLCSKGS